MLVKCLQICAHVFIDRPQNCAQTSFRSCAELRPNFGHSNSKLCPIMCRSRTKLCPNFGCLCARLCPISFAPCPFPNLAGTLYNTLIAVASVAMNNPRLGCDYVNAENSRLDLFASRILSIRVESRVAERSSPSRVSSRRSRYQVKSQVKSIIVKSSPLQSVVRTTRP